MGAIEIKAFLLHLAIAARCWPRPGTRRRTRCDFFIGRCLRLMSR